MNNEAPFASAAQSLRLALGQCDLAERAKNAGITEQKLKDAMAGKVGLESDEIDQLISSPTRSQVVKVATAQDRRHALNKSASS